MSPAHATDGELEESFTTWVVDTFHAYGWRVMHQRPARTAKGWRTTIQGDKGFPDIVAAKDGVVVIAELKKNGKYPEPDQRAWLEALGGAQLESVHPPHVYVWRPRDRDIIVALLRRLGG